MSSDSTTRGDTEYRYQLWIESVRNREPESWDVLVDSYADTLRGDIRQSLIKHSLSLDLLEDISQATWLTAFRNIPSFVWESEDRFYHWLRVISCNHVHRARRQAGREVSVDDHESDEREMLSFFETYRLQGRIVEDEVEANEQMLALVQALRTLKPEEREILVRWLMGDTPQVLAAEYHKLPRTISVTVWRAKQKVEARLAYIQSTRMKKGLSHDDSQ
jgi:RNA polymerase sigma factor (sigma-70 family)